MNCFIEISDVNHKIVLLKSPTYFNKSCEHVYKLSKALSLFILCPCSESNLTSSFFDRNPTILIQKWKRYPQILFSKEINKLLWKDRDFAIWTNVQWLECRGTKLCADISCWPSLLSLLFLHSTGSEGQAISWFIFVDSSCCRECHGRCFHDVPWRL